MYYTKQTSHSHTQPNVQRRCQQQGPQCCGQQQAVYYMVDIGVLWGEAHQVKIVLSVICKHAPVHSGLTAWCSNMSMTSSCWVGFQQSHRANNSWYCRLLPQVFKDFKLMNDSLLLCCKLTQHRRCAIHKCNQQHSPASMHKKWQLRA